MLPEKAFIYRKNGESRTGGEVGNHFLVRKFDYTILLLSRHKNIVYIDINLSITSLVREILALLNSHSILSNLNQYFGGIVSFLESAYSEAEPSSSSSLSGSSSISRSLCFFVTYFLLTIEISAVLRFLISWSFLSIDLRIMRLTNSVSFV
ncbi:hypothetical protein KCU66_g1, partial [Aureobasidium melanogenum]